MMLADEGLDQVFARHARHAAAPRAAVPAWDLELVCQHPDEYSASLTAVVVPEGHDADQLRAIARDEYDLSLGVGLGRLAGKVFRIGHLGDLNDLSLLGTLAGVEMSLIRSAIPHTGGGVQAALRFLSA